MDFLKIDRSFVDGLEEGSDNQVILSAMIGLARSLELKAVVEGVETAEQLAKLKEMGCEMAQGNHFSEPLPSEGFGELLTKGRLPA